VKIEELDFEVIGDITNIKTIAIGNRIHDLDRLQRDYGRGRWRKLKGIALVRLLKSGRVREAEDHWYEAVRREAVRQFAGKPSSGRELNH
jgi:hypothetical protein